MPESLACELAGVSPARRREWAAKGLLKQPKKGARLTELQVVHIAFLREFHDALGPRDAAVAWRQVQDALNERIPVADLDVVVDLGYREATLVAGPNELAAAVRTSRAVRVIPLGPLALRVREAFRRLVPPPAPDLIARGARKRTA